jgi:hypothetical protein
VFSLVRSPVEPYRVFIAGGLNNAR